jgi:hypothetical protein
LHKLLISNIDVYVILTTFSIFQTFICRDQKISNFKKMSETRISDASQIFDSIANVLRQCQQGIASHEKLILKLSEFYAQCDHSVFFDKFIKCVQSMLISMKSNPNTDICIKFVVKFVHSLTTETKQSSLSRIASTSSNNENNTNTNDNDKSTTEKEELLPSEKNFENPIFFRFLDFLLENSKVSYDAVRFRCCQIISFLMNYENNRILEFIDKDLYDRLSDYLLLRLKDVNQKVQV